MHFEENALRACTNTINSKGTGSAHCEGQSNQRLMDVGCKRKFGECADNRFTRFVLTASGGCALFSSCLHILTFYQLFLDSCDLKAGIGGRLLHCTTCQCGHKESLQNVNVSTVWTNSCCHPAFRTGNTKSHLKMRLAIAGSRRHRCHQRILLSVLTRSVPRDSLRATRPGK